MVTELKKQTAALSPSPNFYHWRAYSGAEVDLLLETNGFFFPIEAMPKLLQWISYVVPIRYYLVIIRSLLIKGVGVASLQNEILALLFFAIVIMTLAILRFRKRLD